MASGGGSPPFSRLCGDVTFWPRYQFPLPFPPCPQHVSPLTQAEIILPGLLESLWGWPGALQTAPSLVPDPWYLRCRVLHPHPTPLPPCFFPGGPTGEFSGDACMGQTFLPDHPPATFLQFFPSTHHLYPGHPKDKLELGSYGAKGHLSRLPQPCPDPKSGSSHPRYSSPHSAQLGDAEKVTGPGLVCWSPAPRPHHPWLWPTEQVL